MFISLLWLTVGTPSSWAYQQEVAAMEKNSGDIPPDDPINSTTEEKVPTNNTFSEDYLHEVHITDLLIAKSSLFHKSKNADTYIAYHGELLVPPPNAG
jgi:hypothetical protein